MTVFPQLGSGALSQFPVRKVRRCRTVVNGAADGSSIKLADPAGGSLEWQLNYAGLSDIELGNLQQFFITAEGGLNGFTFLDPSGNLLAWSEELNNTVWQAGPLLALSSGVADPTGGSNGWHLTNSGAGLQSLTQTLNAPGAYVYSFSVYVKAGQATTVTLLAGNQQAVHMATTNWSRLALTATGDASASSIVFGVEIPGSAAVDVFGPQAEAQPAPSVYQTGTTGGVYAGARFRDDTFSYTTTDLGRHSATVTIYYADHL